MLCKRIEQDRKGMGQPGGNSPLFYNFASVRLDFENSQSRGKWWRCIVAMLTCSKTKEQGLERWLRQLENLMLLQRPWIWFPEPTCWFIIIFNSSSRRSSVLFWPLPVPDMNVVHLYTDFANYRQITYVLKETVYFIFFSFSFRFWFF